jgi:Uma2 family endonuclease
MTTVPVRSPARRDAAARPSRSGVFVAEHDLNIPASAFTLAGFRRWASSEEFPESGRISFLAGEVFVDMSPEEFNTHSAVKGEVTAVPWQLNKKLDLGRMIPDGVLLTNPEAGLSTVADASLARWDDLEADRLRLIPREVVEVHFIEVEGTPSWVLEVVSMYSVQGHTNVTRAVSPAGVPEYWLIDARGADIHFEILVRGEEGYEAATGRSGWLPSPVFGRRFRLTRQRDRCNLWDYTLEVRR